MRPRIILHNSVSIDGSLTGFEPHMQLHYRLMGTYKADAHLIGSPTVLSGIQLYGDGVPKEEPRDVIQPKRNPRLPLWVIIDTSGRLSGLLHVCRQFDMVRDIIVLVSEKTPSSYLKYLTKRQYPFHCVGRTQVDLKKAFELLKKKYKITTLATDTGRILGNLLLNRGYVDEISLLVHPVLVGKHAYSMFADILQHEKFHLLTCKRMQKNYVWLVYRPEKK